MKKILMIAVGLAAGAVLFQPQIMQAQEEAAGKDREARRAELVKKYDKNSDGQLDESEKAAMREETKKNREERVLKRYDKNGDGKLDDAEKEAMREELKKRAEGLRKGGEPKGPGTPPPPVPPPAPPVEPKK